MYTKKLFDDNEQVFTQESISLENLKILSIEREMDHLYTMVSNGEESIRCLENLGLLLKEGKAGGEDWVSIESYRSSMDLVGLKSTNEKVTWDKIKTNSKRIAKQVIKKIKEYIENMKFFVLNSINNVSKKINIMEDKYNNIDLYETSVKLQKTNDFSITYFKDKDSDPVMSMHKLVDAYRDVNTINLNLEGVLWGTNWNTVKPFIFKNGPNKITMSVKDGVITSKVEKNVRRFLKKDLMGKDVFKLIYGDIRLMKVTPTNNMKVYTKVLSKVKDYDKEKGGSGYTELMSNFKKIVGIQRLVYGNLNRMTTEFYKLSMMLVVK